MYKIQAASRFNKELIAKYPEAKEQIISNLLVDIAHEMHKHNCFEISEMNVNGEIKFMEPNQQVVNIKALIMAPNEFKEANELFNLIKYYTNIPETLIDLLARLHTIVLKQPI